MFIQRTREQDASNVAPLSQTYSRHQVSPAQLSSYCYIRTSNMFLRSATLSSFVLSTTRYICSNHSFLFHSSTTLSYTASTGTHFPSQCISQQYSSLLLQPTLRPLDGPTQSLSPHLRIHSINARTNSEMDTTGLVLMPAHSPAMVATNSLVSYARTPSASVVV